MALDVGYVNAFIRSVDELFATMVKVPSSAAKPRLMGADEDLGRTFPIAVGVGLSGAAEGVVGVAWSRPVALALASSLAGSAMTELDADCLDALGEIGNLVVGGAKAKLPCAETGGTTMTVPRVVPTDELAFPAKRPVILVPFDVPMGRFVVAVGLRGAGAAAAA